MRLLRRSALALLLAAALALVATVAEPSPPQAKATSLPCIAVSPAGAVSGALGIGNPIGDACEAVTDPVLGIAGKVLDPLREAAESVGKGIFDHITSWVADGAVWLIGEVAKLSEETTSPNLLSKGFLREYRLMVEIAASMAALMVIFAIIEALGAGNAGMLWRVFLVNVPLAAIATSAAYVVVQLLLATSDGMGEVVSHSAGADAHHFFKGAVEALAEAGGAAGSLGGTSSMGPGSGTGLGAAAGAVEVPLFVGFIAAIVAAFAAFFVWIELLMRDAAVYVVALFMPLAIAASIWPRWASALRRTCELVIVIVFSKFVIVSIISLAASLMANNQGAVEHVLAASAMLLLACFAPFLLFKLVPFAEGAVSAAYSRQSASGGAVRTLEHVSSVQMMRRAAQANWGMTSTEGGSAGGGRGGGGSAGGKGGGASKGGGGSGGAEAAGGAAGAAAIPTVVATGAAKSAKSGGQRLAGSGEAQAITDSQSQGSGGSSSGGDGGGGAPSRPQDAGGNAQSRGGSPGGASAEGSSSGSTRSPAAAPQPKDAGGGAAPGEGTAAPRPTADRTPSGGKGEVGQ